MIYTIGFKSDYFKEITKGEALNLIEENRIICTDCETRGLDYNMPNPLKLIQVGTPKDQFIFTPDAIKVMKSVYKNRAITKILVNGVFERNMMRSVGIELNSMFDLSLAFKVYRQGKEVRYLQTTKGKFFIYSLGGMYAELLKIEKDKTEQSSFLKSSISFTKSQLEYAADDVKLFDLYEVLLKRLVKKELIHENYEYNDVQNLISRGLYSKCILEFKFQEFLADMLYNGININKEKWLKLYESNKIEKSKLEMQLNKLVVDNLKEYKDYRIKPFSIISNKQNSLFDVAIREDVDIKIIKKLSKDKDKRKDKRRINWKSSQQVTKIFKKLEIKIPFVKGKQTIGIKELAKIKHTHPILIPYIKYKQLSKLIDSYGKEFLLDINRYTGRIHFQVNQLLETGRIAPSKPNLAQIPSDKEWRDCFDVRSEEYRIVGADYSAQESRVMAYKSKDPKFIDFFENGDGDSHSMVASNIYSAKEKLDIKVSKYKLTIDYVVPEKKEYARKLAKGFYPKANKETVENNKVILECTRTEDKEQCPLRGKGKVTNFFISFGGSGFTLSQDQGIPIEEANSLINSYWSSFSTLENYFKEQKKLTLKLGYSLINNVTKGKRFYPGYKTLKELANYSAKCIKEIGYKNYRKASFEKGTDINRRKGIFNKLKGEIERAAMNTSIQGTAADMTKTAGILLLEKVKENNLSLIRDIMPVNMIHDELLLEADSKLDILSSKLLQEAMEEASIIFIGITIPAKAYIAKEWKH